MDSRNKFIASRGGSAVKCVVYAVLCVTCDTFDLLLMLVLWFMRHAEAYTDNALEKTLLLARAAGLNCFKLSSI